MNVSLSFFEGGVEALRDGLMQYERQQALPAAQRDAYLLAGVTQTIHLAAERLLKHVVAKVDPYLLLEEPKVELLKTLRKAMIHQGASSIFMSSVSFKTLNPGPLAKLIQEVTHPGIDEQQFTSFSEAFRLVTTLRNAVAHGELNVDADKLLADLRRLLGELYALLQTVSPEALATLAERDGQALSRLRAFREESDAAWAVLTDYLETHGAIEVSSKVYVTTLPDGSASIVAGNTLTQPNGFAFHSELSPQNVSGLFALLLTEEQISARRMQRTLASLFQAKLSAALGVPAPEPTPPRIGALLGSLGLGTGTPYESPTVEPLEDGAISVDSGLGLLYLRLSDLPGRQLLTVAVSLLTWEFAVTAKELQGTVNGMLVAASRNHRAIPMVEAHGTIALEGEYSVTETNAPSELVPGSVVRILRVTARLQLPKEPRKLVTVPSTM